MRLYSRDDYKSIVLYLPVKTRFSVYVFLYKDLNNDCSFLQLIPFHAYNASILHVDRWMYLINSKLLLTFKYKTYSKALSKKLQLHIRGIY